MEGQVIHYSGENYLNGILIRDDIVAKNDEGLMAILNDTLSKQQDISFMAVDNEGLSQKINRKYCYVLQLYSSLINDQKVVITLLGIQVFFDIFVPNGESPNECEEKLLNRKKIIFIQMVLGKERKLLKLVTSKLHQMTCSHFIVRSTMGYNHMWESDKFAKSICPLLHFIMERVYHLTTQMDVKVDD
ncbi:hypothetical protein C1645_741669 [Glomus cerebriforme]|uniref:Uncharacterized protein n=1 Tax=Glomus cerebriforme TaxID=658196 RepID=A0A397SGG3_9GLOM|nr:hypothetical protein C1645_741669 [Glomus cerebriforme]